MLPRFSKLLGLCENKVVEGIVQNNVSVDFFFYCLKEISMKLIPVSFALSWYVDYSFIQLAYIIDNALYIIDNASFGPFPYNC